MILSLTVVLVAAAFLLLVLRKRTLRGAAGLVAFGSALLAWAAAYGLFLKNVSPGSLAWLSLIHLAAAAASTALLIFSVYYTNHGDWVNYWSLLLLALEPCLTQLFIWIPRWRESFFISVPAGPVPLHSAGPWYWINLAYSYGLLLMGIIILAQIFMHKSRQFMYQSITIAGGLFIPILFQVLILAGFEPFPNMELAPFSFGLTCTLFIIVILVFKLLDFRLISRGLAVESMSDGWMVIDLNNRIIDLNPAAEMLIGASRRELFSLPADQIMSNWPDLNQEVSAREVETRGSMTQHGEVRFLNIRFLPLRDQTEKQIGTIVLWRDITERKRTDDAHQQARDEMFILLHSISGAASQTLNLDEFLSEASRQIVYAFQSQVSLIFLLESGIFEESMPNYYLAAQYGVPKESLPHLSNSREVAAIIAEVMETREPFFIPDVSSDLRLPVGMQKSGNKTMLLVPLLTREQVLGAVGLTRRDGVPYSEDEINRIVVVAEELASLIDNDRQRQLAIALEERQRLVRDLHDSVTQKLYGLVQLTEAAQASMENGTPAQSTQMVKRIGENARQALKEMRLFLFERKPVDLEHEGLVSVLHQRLAAVEGRADIKARLVADEEIDLPVEKQVALYYIAQEALNNILKHANAHSVDIRLKKKKLFYELEIIDDGCGFEMAKTDKGGMGLHNMHERVARAGGRLAIKSMPGKGTKITATVSKDKVAPVVKKRNGKK
jgi:PAS domain S-box-containing protein